MRNHIISTAICTLSLTILVGATGMSVHAQSPDSIAVPVVLDATVSSVLRKDQAVDTIGELRALYKSQIETYRSSEQQYSIAKEQNARLQTLASLEEAVRATREALLNRSRVLVTYVQMIRVTLEDIPGVELSLKQLALARLSTLEQKLLVHQDAVLNTETRAEIAARADEFEALQDEMDSTIYLTQSLVSHGKVQTIYDQALIVQRDIENYHNAATASALVIAERGRAHVETKRNLQDIQGELRELTLVIQKQSEKLEGYTKASHDRMLGDLETPHVHLTQLVGYLAELLRL